MNENMEMKKWDLTTAQGFLNALAFTSPIAGIFSFLKDFFNTDNSKQAELAKELIEISKKEGVDEIEIKMKKTAGMKLKLPEEYKVEANIGKDDEMTIIVKYK